MIDIPPRNRPFKSFLALIVVILVFESGCGTSHEAESKQRDLAVGRAEAQAKSDAPQAQLATRAQSDAYYKAPAGPTAQMKSIKARAGAGMGE